MALLSFMARLGLDATGFEKNMARADSQVANFGNNTLGALKGQLAAAFSVAVVVGQLKDAINYAGQLTDQMKRLGVSSEFLQGWGYGLRKAGASAEDLTGFIEKLTASREKALDGDKGALGAFAKFGVTVSDLESMDLEGLSRKIANVFTTGNPQEFVTSLRELGGRGAGRLIPAFVENIEDAEAEAVKLGVVLNKEARVSLDNLGDAFTTKGDQAKVFFGNLVKWAIDSEAKMVSLTSATIAFATEFARLGKDDPEKWAKKRPLSDVAHDAMTSRYLRERESGTGIIGSGGLALGDFIKAHFRGGGTGPGDQLSAAMKVGGNEQALVAAMQAGELAAAIARDDANKGGPPGKRPTFGPGVFAEKPNNFTWTDSMKDRTNNLTGGLSKEAFDALVKQAEAQEKSHRVLEEISRKLGQGAVSHE